MLRNPNMAYGIFRKNTGDVGKWKLQMIVNRYSVFLKSHVQN